MKRLLVSVGVALVCLMTVPLVASAHERRTVGDYQLTVGFLNEPPIAEEPNGLDLRVAQGQGNDAKPVEGLADTLKAEVKAGGQTMPLALAPAFGKPGSYQANFIPTAAGTYAFHVFGTINGQRVDETFVSGPNTFNDVQERTALSFPKKVPPVSSVDSLAASAKDEANTARMLGIGGMVLGVLGLFVGGLGLTAARRAREDSSPVRRETQDVTTQK